ncbi:MAG: dihydropteroate synthase [bacterium]
MTEQTITRPDEIKRVIKLMGSRQLPLSRPLIMGVLNVTPDSFSDGGRFLSVSDAVNRGLQMAAEGADIIDIGGESSRPGAQPVTAKEEQRRVLPVIENLRRETDLPISIDTYHAATAEAALDTGADIVNDISALRFDTQMAPLVAERKVPLVLMHMLGTPRDMQNDPHYDNCVDEIVQFFEERISFCRQNGIDKSKLILDPGIGFGKRLGDNLLILSSLGEFKRFSLPLLVGTSRKSFIGMINAIDSPADQRLGGSLAAAVVAVINGANIVRVHDLAETVEAIKVIQAIRKTV